MKRAIRIASPLTALGLALALAATSFGRHAAAAPLDSGATETNVTRLTTSVLEHSQFAHHPFDSELAGTLLDRYLDALDGTRSLFLQVGRRRVRRLPRDACAGYPRGRRYHARLRLSFVDIFSAWTASRLRHRDAPNRDVRFHGPRCPTRSIESTHRGRAT